MTAQTSVEIPVKPRVLIADDSRIVRATLIKHIEGLFDFREALDGEQAWETLLIDPNIRVVITDLTMPKLDGYGLLQRIRNSKIGRIREIPVVVVSGSDDREERERAKAAGANDLITKGIDTAQLLSRLDILSRLVTPQRDFERGLERLARHAAGDMVLPLTSSESMRDQAGALLANAVKNKKNFVMLNIRIGLKQGVAGAADACPPAAVIDAIGQLLRRIVRESDRVAKTGNAEFTIATGSINFNAARSFAIRVCRAIANASLSQGQPMSFIGSCGVASLSDCGSDAASITVDMIAGIARRRALFGLAHGVTGVIGPEEENSVQRDR
jgi:PleD family two-component response regulator